MRKSALVLGDPGLVHWGLFRGGIRKPNLIYVVSYPQI
jgi:hypothetical protein